MTQAQERALMRALEGSSGRHTPAPGDTDYLPPPVRQTLQSIIASSGIAPGPAQEYAARKMRYHLGKGGAPSPPTAVMGPAYGWLEQRIRDVLDDNRHRLPPLNERTMTS